MCSHWTRSRYLLFCLAMVLLLGAVALLAISLGAVDLKPAWILQIVLNKLAGRDLFPPVWPDSAVSIVWELRMPKVVAAVCIGAALSVAGILMQALTRNPLADPYVLGISSGASAGAVAAMLFGGLPLVGRFSLQAGAFGGALLASLLVFLLAGAGRADTTRLVLTGMALAAVFQALTNLLIFLSPDSRKVSSALFWMTGSLGGVTWADIPLVCTVGLTGLLTAILASRPMDLLLMGEARAITLGVETVRLRRLLILLGSLLTGVMVSLAGAIGFVGLVVPHVARTLFGAAHRRLLPAAALMGGVFLLLADMLARMLARPEELPIGIVTALCGAPFFLWLLHKSRYRFGE